MSEKPRLSRATFEFIQDGNGLGTTEEYEELTIECEGNEADITKDCFLVLRTKGWSINDIEELSELKELIRNFEVK